MKTASEIIDKYFSYNEFDKKRVIEAMEEFADQFKYDYSQSCKCEENTGSTWCCNICGLPENNESKARKQEKKVVTDKEIWIEADKFYGEPQATIFFEGAKYMRKQLKSSSNSTEPKKDK